MLATANLRRSDNILEDAESVAEAMGTPRIRLHTFT